MGRGRPPLDFRDDAEIRLLRRFTPTHDWVLGPGDMLYLPPQVPHHGVAEDPCLTFSLGMRAPSVAELMGDYVDTLAAAADDALRYTDADLDPAGDPHEIDSAAMARVVQALNAVRMPDADALGDWFGRFITLYRAAAGPGQGEGQPLAVDELSRALDGGLVVERYPWTRVAWRRAARGARLYAAGGAWPMAVADARRLAAEPRVDAGAWSRLGGKGRECLAALLAGGQYQLAEPDAEVP
jgi:50S ribosomal protein L16 3-hydroxylase